MSVEETFGNYFKPEMKSSGRKLLSFEKISISSQSDTFIQAYVRVAPPFKVTLTAQDIASTNFLAECNCPVAKKSRFCKHVWATLLAVEEKCADFLENKTEINKSESASFGVHAEPAATAKVSYSETAKARASVYRKDQYQKQKARVKDKKRERQGLESAQSSSAYTPDVEAALAYFALNGFPMPAGPSREILSEAKRTLSRVFHPDKGGAHEEVVELNAQCEILIHFLQA
jgi:hypothetical protein